MASRSPRPGEGDSARVVPRGGTLGDELAQLDAELFVGRDAELAVFRDWLTEDSGPDRPGLRPRR